MHVHDQRVEVDSQLTSALMHDPLAQPDYVDAVRLWCRWTKTLETYDCAVKQRYAHSPVSGDEARRRHSTRTQSGRKEGPARL
jgi:hypothetical protein